jgi:hypothetical protein
MAEIRLVHTPEIVEYQGIVSIKDINRVVFDFFTQQGYTFYENYQNETVTEKGKSFTLKGDFKKKLNYYAESIIPYKIKGSNVVDVEIMRDKRKISLNKGDVAVEFEAVLKTDLEGRYEVNLMGYLLRAFSERFFFKRDIDALSQTISKDFKKAMLTVRGFMNLQKYT